MSIQDDAASPNDRLTTSFTCSNSSAESVGLTGDERGSDQNTDPQCCISSVAVFSSCSCRYRLRPLKSKAAIFVLVSNLLVFGAARSGINICLGEILPLADSLTWKQTVIGSSATTVLVISPLFGWLADTYIGRYRIIRGGIWALWLGSVILTVLSLIQYSDSNYRIYSYPLYIVLFVVYSFGMASYDSNIVPFGVDQIYGASSEELSTFISWYIWTGFLGYGVVSTFFFGCIRLHSTNLIRVFETFTQAVIFSLALVLDAFLRHWLTIEPARGDPIKKTALIVKYALRVRRSEQARYRSALTFWEEDIPSRMDLPKERYGGPYSTEDVEDAKSVLRIMLLFICVVPSLVVFANAQVTMDSHFKNAFVNFNTTRSVTHCFETALISNFNTVIAIIVIPVYLFVILPIFQKIIPRTLVRVIIGICLNAAGMTSELLLHAIAHAIDSEGTHCFLDTASLREQLQLDYHWLLFPHILSGLGWLVVIMSMLEFVCAQAPHTTRGFINGIAYGAVGLSYGLSLVIVTIFYKGFEGHSTTVPSCGFWYYLFNLVLQVVGLILFGLAVHHYKPRERNELSFRQTHVERHFNLPSRI